MAIIIDFTGKEPPKETPVSAVADPTKPAALKPASPGACKHGRTVIDEEKRIVTCSDCGADVDPFSYILVLYAYYETRVDRRLAAIKESEKREAERRERDAKRKQEPRRSKIERRAETAERAAYNEYQAKVLQLRAERQHQLVQRLDAEISAMGGTV